jgi:deoxyribodipyrimidine photolyase-related protein
VETVWILGDQLNRDIASLEGVEPGETRILMVESQSKLRSKRWHRQRLHLVVAAMRRFAAELEEAGFEVDYRKAATLEKGLAAHRRRFRPSKLRAMEPNGFDLRRRLEELDVDLVRSNLFLCHYEDFAEWAKGQKRLRMEDFYRWQRTRLGYLMEKRKPAGGRWNFDADNREPPPKGEPPWSAPPSSKLDGLDAEILGAQPAGLVGEEPSGLWATSRRSALARLRRFVKEELPRFGPHEDAMTRRSWHLAHSLLSPYLNLGLLRPGEVCDAVQAAYDEGRVPIASAEGFVRQVIGWREYVWGVYWLWMPEYREQNALGAKRGLPPAFQDSSRTRMRCVAETVRGIEEHGYAHHIQRLMVLGNLSLLAGIEPMQVVDWMWASFVDGAEWVMLPNVLSMALYADDGRMTTKPYAAGGAYISRMSDYCGACPFDPKQRVGERACPFTTLYWDFLARHEKRLAGNPRVARQVYSLNRLRDLPEVRKRAREVLEELDRGEL